MSVFKRKTEPSEKSISTKTLSQWQLIHRRFRKHRLAVTAMFVLAAIYTLAVFAEFFATYPANLKRIPYIYCPPQQPRFNFTDGLHVNMVRQHTDPITFK